jgi:exonuclease III
MSETLKTFNILQWNCRSIRGKKHYLQNLAVNLNVHAVALQETWLQEDEIFHLPGFNILRKDGPDGYRGVLMAVRNDIKHSQSLSMQSENGEMIGVQIETVEGTLNIVSAYNAISLGINPRYVESALLEVSHPMVVCGDFNTHSQAWGCENEDGNARVVHAMFDNLRLVHLNDGSFTRIAAPPHRSSAIDLTLCSSDLALGQYSWKVLDDAAGSDHLPILTTIGSKEISSETPLPIFDLTRHISWSTFAESVLNSLPEITDNMTLHEGYGIFMEIISQSAVVAQTRSPSAYRTFTVPKAVWWDTEYDSLNDLKSAAFKKFRDNANSTNYENLQILEMRMKSLCNEKKKQLGKDTAPLYLMNHD